MTSGRTCLVLFRKPSKSCSFAVGSGCRPRSRRGPMARLPRLIGRGRALEVLLGSDYIRCEFAKLYGYVNRSLPVAELDDFVDALATRTASYDKWTIANTKHFVNATCLPSDLEIAAGWEVRLSSVTRLPAQERVKLLFEQDFHKPGEAENALGLLRGTTCSIGALLSENMLPTSYMSM